MCPSGTTCLSTDCCFSQLALYKSSSACWSSTKRISSSSYWKLTCSRHDIAEKIAKNLIFSNFRGEGRAPGAGCAPPPLTWNPGSAPGNIIHKLRYCLVIIKIACQLHALSGWVSECCLTPIQQFFQLYHDENKLIFNKMMMRSALY
jgi:hypothetical protein